MFFFDPPSESPLATSVPCIVQLSIGGGQEHRYYGPFASLNDARQWCDRQTVSNFAIIPLRRTDKDRDYNEWYGPEMHDINILIEDFYGIAAFQEWQESVQ